MINCGYNNVYPSQSACTNSYASPCSTSFTTTCVNPCINPCTNLCTNSCINYCNNRCTNYCNNCCNLPSIEIPPTSNGIIHGCKGPFCWDIDYYIDESDITKDFFKIKLTFLGVSVVNTTLDINNPKIVLDLTISGTGLRAELGVDFTQRIIYLRGYIDLYYYKKTFDLILYKF